MGTKDVLFLCQFFYPEYISSATLPFDTAKALVEAGFSVDVFSGYPKEYSSEKKKIKKSETIAGIGIKRVSYMQLNRKRKIGRIVNYFTFTIAIMTHFFKMKKYKVILVYSNPPMLPIVAAWAKQWFKNKLIFVTYDLYPELALVSSSIRKDSFIERIFNKINDTVFKNVDKVVSLSTEMKNYISTHRFIEAEKIVVIPNWYKDEGELTEITPNNIFYDNLHGKFIVSYFGNMGTIQDIEVIVNAIRILKDDTSVHFLFAGHGNKLENIKEIILIENLKNVTICNFLRGKEYEDALSISSCALVSLISGATGLCVPSKTYGYMMKGLPLIAIMNESDIVDDVKAGAGEYVTNNNPNELVEKINYLKDNPSIREKESKKCREIFLEKYTTEICTKRYVDLISEILYKEV